jgi:integrase
LPALTQNRIDRAQPKVKPYELRDGGTRGVAGLLIRIQPSGTKTYYFEFGRGKRIRIGTHHITLGRARVLASNYRAAVDQGQDPRKTLVPITLGDFMEKVYEPHFKAHHRNTASLGNLTAWKPLHGKKLTELTADLVKRERSKRLTAGRKAATINRNVGALKTVLNFAVEEGYLETNPLAGVGALRVENPNRVRYLTAAEEKRLREALEARERRIRDERASGNAWRAERGYPPLPDLSNLPFADHLRPMVLLTMNTGLRRGELFNLKWSHVVGDAITVARSKSGKGRHVPLNKEARKVLEDWQAMGTETWVFESGGKPFDNVNKAWKAITKAADIPDFRWHDLRHHFASRLVVAGVPINTVRELMGHSDIKMTLRYAHLAPGHMREAVEAISNV